MSESCYTYSGRVVYFISEDAAGICIEDIAHSLSLQCRYNGHVSNFFSVAQHSIHVAQQLPERLKLTGLLHDAAEAYIGDVITPFKERFPRIQEAEESILKRVMTLYGGIFPLPDEVVEVDRRMLVTEIRDLGSSELLNVVGREGCYDTKINPWEPKIAEKEFLSWFYSLYRKENGRCENANI